MGLFDGVGGPMGGTMPLGTMTPMGVATSMGAAASAVGVPGFSMMPPTFPLIAGMGWSSRSSYFGHPEFRGVADMAIGSNDLQRGWAPGVGLGAGLGTFLGAPPIGSGGYYIGPGPQFFDPMAMFAWMYQQTFGAQQPAGPAQAAAPQPAQVNARGEEPKADEAKGAAKGGKSPRFKGGGKSKKAAAAPAAAGPAAGGPAAAPASAKPSGAATSASGASPASGAEKPMTEEEARRTVEIMGKAIRTDEEKAFLDRMKREHPSVFKK